MSADPLTTRGCREYAALSRRSFLRRAGAGVAAVAALPAWLPRVAFGAGGDRDVLVQVFLRGGMDGLTTCVPYGDGELYRRRPTLAIRPPGGAGGAIDLDGFFGLAPAARPLLPPYRAGHLAFVHATGAPDPTRSHFDAMQLMEFGVPGIPVGSVATGWLARHLLSMSPAGSDLLRALAMDIVLPNTLAGAPATVPAPDPDRLAFPGRATTVTYRRQVLSHMYAAAPEPLRRAAGDSLDTIDLLSRVDFVGYAPAPGAAYPDTVFGQKLRSTAALIKAEVGVECVTLDLGGWDHHSQEGPLTGAMARLLDELSRALGAFYVDMGAGIATVTLIVMSEFGRRVSENASGGADHGHGNCMILMGGGIAGGRVLARWPGLALDQLDRGDLAITIDYRDVLAEVLTRRLGNTRPDLVFPGYTPTIHGITV
jgi:uncharacterized protein (DUF1501 family)